MIDNEDEDEDEDVDGDDEYEIERLTVNDLIKKLQRAADEFSCGESEIWISFYKEFDGCLGNIDMDFPISQVGVREKTIFDKDGASSERRVIQLSCTDG